MANTWAFTSWFLALAPLGIATEALQLAKVCCDRLVLLATHPGAADVRRHGGPITVKDMKTVE